MRRQVVFVSVGFLVLVAACNFPGGGQATCCSRKVGYLPAQMPEGQVRDMNGLLEGGFFSSILALGTDISDCPKEVGIYNPSIEKVSIAYLEFLASGGKEISPVSSEEILNTNDYIFIPSLTMNDRLGYDEENQMQLGHFNYSMQLVDIHHGETLKQASETWFEGRNIRDVFTSRQEMIAAAKALGEEFMPLDDLIHDYERLPEELSVDLQKDYVLNNEEMTITLNGIVDDRGRTPRSWWRIVVDVEYGEILNAPERHHDSYVFRVGQGGSIDIQYRAPANCPCSRSDTITVYNTCYLNETVPPLKEKKLASETFEIICSNFELDIEYNQTMRIPAVPFVDERQCSGTVEFSANTETEPPSLIGDAQLQLSGSGSAPECTWTHSGTVDVFVGGEMLIEGEEEPRLMVELEDTFNQSTTVYCEGTYQFPQAPVTIPPEHEFPYEDGYMLEWEVGAPGLPVEGSATWTLHIPCVE
jgi:hypothetical protein